jgi:hypothetical protein
VSTPSETPPQVDGQSEEPANKPQPLQLDLPAATTHARPAEPSVSQRARGPARSPAYTLTIAFAAIVALGALAAALVVWALPQYLRRQCIEVAAKHGIDLSVDDARIDPAGFRLVGVHASLTAVGGARAQASEVEVETSGLRPQKMTVRGAELMLHGSLSAVESDFEKWRSSPGGGQAGGWAPASLAVEGARIVWQASTGENGRVEAADVQAEFQWHERDTADPINQARDPELHVRSDRVAVAVPGAVFGPWRVDIDRSKGSSRTRVALDPGVPDACTILVVGDGDRTTSVDVVIPRSRPAHLGLPEELLELHGSALQVETTIHYVALGPARADATVRGGIYGIEAPGLPRAIDVVWEGTARGDPTAGVDVRKARLAIGPLVGALTGTLKRFDDGFRVDLAWAAGPVPCAAFSVPLGLGQPFDIDYAIRKLAVSATRDRAAATLADGALGRPERVQPLGRGAVSATVMFSFDSRNLAATKLEFTPEIGCLGLLFQ